MKDIQLKIIHVFLPFVVVTLVTIIGYSAIRWWLDIQLGMLPIQGIWLDFMFPLFISYIMVSLWMNKRFQILDINNKQKDHSFYYKLAMSIFISVPLIIAQIYISSASYDLNHLQSPSQLRGFQNEKFFKIDQFKVDGQKCEYFVTSQIRGKYNEDLDFKLYYACPFDATDPPVFYGIKYAERIDNDFTDAQKQMEYKRFIRASQTSFRQVNFQEVEYFQKEDYTDHLKGYAEAILKKYPDLESKDQIILIPKNDSFEERDDSTFKWFFIMLGVAFIICFVMVAIPAVDSKGLKAFHNNENLYESSLILYFKLLMAIGKNKGMSFLILCNCIVFLVMLFSGVDLLYPTSKELFQFGGETKESVMKGEYWRLFTSMFVHRGGEHLFSNLISLTIVGYLLEPILKPFKFITIYLLCGIISGIASIYWYPIGVSIGASGAISGLFGLLIAFNVFKIFSEGMTSIIWMIFFTLLFITVFVAFIMNNISHAAHIAGFVSGFFIGTLWSLVQGDTLRKAAKLYHDSW